MLKDLVAEFKILTKPFGLLYLTLWKLVGLISVANYLPSRDGFGLGPAQSKSARAYIPPWPRFGPGPKAAHRMSAQKGLGPSFFGPGPAQENVGPHNWPKMALNLPKIVQFGTKLLHLKLIKVANLSKIGSRPLVSYH